MKIRLKDIAEEVGVSIAAVSQVLNDKPIRISEKKKRLIKQLAKENNYSPNIAAKSLVLNKTNTIGLVIPDINNPFFAQLAKVLEDQLRKIGYLLILVNSDDHFAAEKELIQLLISACSCPLYSLSLIKISAKLSLCSARMYSFLISSNMPKK